MTSSTSQAPLAIDENAQELDVSAPDTAYERETTVNMNDGDPLVRIWTMQRTVLTKLRKKPEIFTETAHGHNENFEWASFTCPRSRFNLGAAARPPRQMTDEQRAAMSERAKRQFAKTHSL